MAPELAKYEIGNALLKGKRLPTSKALIVLEKFYSLPISYINETEKLAQNTYKLAHKLGLTYYDASFISLAEHYSAILVTDNIKHQGKAKSTKVIELKGTGTP